MSVASTLNRPPITFGTPLQLQPGEDKREFLERARAAVLAARPGRE